MPRSATAAVCLAAVSLCLAWPGAATAQDIAFTWDDLPSHANLPPGETRVGIMSRLIGAMADAGMPPVYGFTNAGRLIREPEAAIALDLWRAAGNPLGNHGWLHIRLNDHSVAEFEDDIHQNERALRDRMHGADWRWFRYPYLAEGGTPEQRAAIRDYLRRKHYRIAAVTLSFDDWAYNDPYARCRAKGDEQAIAGLEERYLRSAEASLAWARAASQALYGRDIPLVLLMHVGAFDARMLPRLLTLYRSIGARFVTLEAAEADAFYQSEVTLTESAAQATLDNALRERGLPMPPRGWNTEGLDALCR